MKLLDKIKLTREANRIERCHLVPHARPYMVGLHTCDLLGLLVFLWEAEYNEFPPQQVLLAALFHDTPERRVGDIPSQVKRLLDSKKLEREEEKVLQALGVNFELSDLQKKWIYWCDVLELYIWTFEEERTGNKEALGIRKSIEVWRSDNYMKLPASVIRFTDMLKDNQIQGFPRLSETLEDELDDSK